MEKNDPEPIGETILHFPLTGAEIIDRNYGRLYSLSAKNANLKFLQVLLMEIEPGGLTSKHYHPNEEVFYMIEGEGICHTEEGTFEIKAGDTVVVPSNQIHQFENKTVDKTCRILISLSPPRDPSLVVYL